MDEAISVFSVVSTVIGIVGTVCAIIFGYIAFSRNKRNDDEKEGKQDGMLLTEIGYIKSGVDDIKRKQEKQDDKYEIVIERLSAVEQSAKQGHKRVDHIEHRIDKLECDLGGG